MSSPSFSLPQKKSLAATPSPEMLHVIALALVGVVVILPMIFWGVPSALDLSNHFRFALPFYDGLRAGHLYPGWLAESNHGFGDASFRFYPPALYYLLAAARTVTGNWYAATVATFALLSMLGAFGVYYWAREFTSSQNAMWAGIFYAVAPYHLNELYQALLLAEFAAAAILPFAFAFTERVCRHRRPKDVAGLAAAYALLVLTHLPLAVIGSIALAIYALFRISRVHIWRTLAALIISVSIGLAASACYWTTMLAELKWIRADNVNPEPGLDYRYNFVLSTFSPETLNVWWMNILLLFTLAMFWPALALVKRGARENAAQVQPSSQGATISIAVVLVLSLFMATPLSRPVWNAIRPLQETQLPWRWLSITSMACAVVIGLAIPFWSRLAKTRTRPLALLALGTIAIAFAFSVSHIVREARWLTPAQFQQTLTAIPGSLSVYQWLPVWVREPFPQISGQVEAGGRSVAIDSWTPEKRLFHVSAGNADEARVRTFFYPHWTATAGNQQLATRPDQNGALMITLPKEAVDVTLEFREPKRARGAAGLTAIGWIAIGGLLVKRRKDYES
jgi:uncharacterized membrane protein